VVEDLDVFFADWGEDATLDSAPVRVLFGSHSDIALGMYTDQPRAMIASASIPARGASDHILVFDVASTPTRAWKRWYVRETKPDGTGMATMVLAKHPDQS
jgi:hypothetical protein